MPDSVGVLTDRVAALGDSIDELLLTVASLDGPGADTDPRARTDDRLRELLVGLERVRNAADAAQATVMVAMDDEARRLDAAEYAATGLPGRSHREFVPDEIGVLLACTKEAAGRRYGLALRSLEYPAVVEAWRAGQIDARKVKTITDELTALSDPEVSGGWSPAQITEVTEQLADRGRVRPHPHLVADPHLAATSGAEGGARGCRAAPR